MSGWMELSMSETNPCNQFPASGGHVMLTPSEFLEMFSSAKKLTPGTAQNVNHGVSCGDSVSRRMAVLTGGLRYFSRKTRDCKKQVQPKLKGIIVEEKNIRYILLLILLINHSIFYERQQIR